MDQKCEFVSFSIISSNIFEVFFLLILTFCQLFNANIVIIEKWTQERYKRKRSTKTKDADDKKKKDD